METEPSISQRPVNPAYSFSEISQKLENMMKFGANTFIWADKWSGDLVPLLGRLKEAGFDGIEIPLINPDQLEDPELRRALERNGLECTVCSVLPQGLNTVSSDAEIRRR